MQGLAFITLGIHFPIHLTKLVNINSHYISSSQERNYFEPFDKSYGENDTLSNGTRVYACDKNEI